MRALRYMAGIAAAVVVLDLGSAAIAAADTKFPTYTCKDIRGKHGANHCTPDTADTPVKIKANKDSVIAHYGDGDEDEPWVVCGGLGGVYGPKDDLTIGKGCDFGNYATEQEAQRAAEKVQKQYNPK